MCSSSRTRPLFESCWAGSCERPDHRISLAEDGIAALRVMDEHDDVEVVITDVVMRTCRGELASAARARGFRKVFIYMSGYPFSHSEEQGDRDRTQYVENLSPNSTC